MAAPATHIRGLAARNGLSSAVVDRDRSKSAPSGAPSVRAGSAVDDGVAAPRILSERELVAVYDDLRRVAQNLLANERTGVSIQATTLVHEIWMRLRSHHGEWIDERHYFNTAVRAMRRYLIDRARERNALRRGGQRSRLDLDDVSWSRLDIPILREIPVDDLTALDIALAELERAQPRAAEVAQLRWIADLTIEQVADVLRVSLDTVKRDWRFARAWLRTRIRAIDGADPAALPEAPD